MPSLLLTGATGFIGYYITHTLAAAGRPFRALIRLTSDTRYLDELGEYCEVVIGDVNDPDSLLDALSGIDTIVHAAAAVSFDSRDEDRLMKVNAEGTANVVNAALEMGTRRLVHLSSVAALNRISGGPVVTLKDRWPIEEPNTNYARSKFAAEREAWRGQAEGLSVAALYPSIVLGAGDWNGHNTPALWRRVAAGQKLYPKGSGGFVDVRDVARAVLDVLDRDLDGDRFLLNAANLSWRELLASIAESIGQPPPSVAVAPWQSALLWPLEGLRAKVTGTPALLTRESQRNAQAQFAYDGSAYAEALGRPYIPIDQTVKEVGAAFRLATAGRDGDYPPTWLPVR